MKVLIILISTAITMIVQSLACVKTGCSGQLCSEEPMMSTCEWTQAYACYGSATCEIQEETGRCGWTMTNELQNCLAEAKIRKWMKSHGI